MNENGKKNVSTARIEIEVDDEGAAATVFVEGAEDSDLRILCVGDTWASNGEAVISVLEVLIVQLTARMAEMNVKVRKRVAVPCMAVPKSEEIH